MPRQAMVLIADEILFNLYGKVFLHGVYNNDLIIPRDPSGSPQLIFYFAHVSFAVDNARDMTVPLIIFQITSSLLA